MITETDLKHLRRCVELAKIAVEKGDQPFGSVLVSKDGEVLFEDHNHVSQGDNTRHPEFEIARWAGTHMTLEERQQATVYTSGEHCPMCAAAHGHAKLGRIVYASSSKQLNEWLSELNVERTSKVRPLSIEGILVNTPVEGPVQELEDEIFELHKQYYHR